MPCPRAQQGVTAFLHPCRAATSTGQGEAGPSGPWCGWLAARLCPPGLLSPAALSPGLVGPAQEFGSILALLCQPVFKQPVCCGAADWRQGVGGGIRNRL